MTGNFLRGSGVAFRDGRLFVFSPRHTDVIDGFPKLKAWRYSVDRGSWSPHLPELPAPALRVVWNRTAAYRQAMHSAQREFAFVGEMVSAGLGSPILRWYFMVPDILQKEMLHMPEGHFCILSMLARCGDPALDLLRGNAAIAFCLANCRHFDRSPTWVMRTIRRLLRRPQRAALAFLGFPDTESCRKLLSRVDRRALTFRRMIRLRAVLRGESPWHDDIRHLGRLTAGLLDLACHTEPLIQTSLTMSFLDEINRDPRSRWGDRFILREITDALAMCKMLGRPAVKFRSMAHLLALHDELSDELASRCERVPGADFPTPPIEGTDCIRPIVTSRALMREGRLMRHCIGSYADRVQAGCVYVYRVMPPLERATLAIGRMGPQSWAVEDIRGSRNETIGMSTWMAVGDWLRLRLPVPDDADAVVRAGVDVDELPF